LALVDASIYAPVRCFNLRMVPSCEW
jgi:hypothetical protein